LHFVADHSIIIFSRVLALISPSLNLFPTPTIIHTHAPTYTPSSTGPPCDALQLAALDHFRTQPASFLAAAALEGPEALQVACKELPSAGELLERHFAELSSALETPHVNLKRTLKPMGWQL
jgi:hypothetical protein